MECGSLHSFYLSAPTSPNWLSPEPVQFYSAQSSPFQQIGSGSFGYWSGADKTKNDAYEFEFETGKMFGDRWEPEEHKYRLPARANSFSTVSFADELFCNGQVLPLKPPPRLQNSVPTSPNRSFSSRVRNPFAQRSTWNDGFDPFMIALEKVSEETEGRVSVHRRSRSYSPFRTDSVSRRVNCSVDSNQGEEKESTITEMVNRKGSMYSRWVRSQTIVKKRSEWSMQQKPTARTMIKRLCLGRNEPVKPVKLNEQASTRESKMQKLKSVLLRYASLNKDTSESKKTSEIISIAKVSYFKRLSHSFKTNPRKKEPTEPKMSILKHDMKLTRCLVHAQGSPKWL
ncbi:hypothetical protein R6Q59_007381 [Mikania micrantha]|uniref:Uncharacterized protein n=1 Tax=Mikania micrantha TaxID=192012 RepID=A0A5N6PYX6_9ASTR|nr:hypothetical protein E3N88_00720 [Mikania micrantha]